MFLTIPSIRRRPRELVVQLETLTRMWCFAHCRFCRDFRKKLFLNRQLVFSVYTVGRPSMYLYRVCNIFLRVNNDKSVMPFCRVCELPADSSRFRGSRWLAGFSLFRGDLRISRVYLSALWSLHGLLSSTTACFGLNSSSGK